MRQAGVLAAAGMRYRRLLAFLTQSLVVLTPERVAPSTQYAVVDLASWHWLRGKHAATDRVDADFEAE